MRQERMAVSDFLDELERQLRSSPRRFSFMPCPLAPGEPPLVVLGLALAIRRRGWSVAVFSGRFNDGRCGHGLVIGSAKDA